tara:strand:- start:619 stop:1404 length:786 start_codon:yes stop_codon:yes gene_type:complete
MPPKNIKKNTTYAATESTESEADVEAAAFTTIGAPAVTPTAEEIKPASTSQNPWTSPTSVIFLLTLGMGAYVAWVYGAFSFEGQNKPEPSVPAAAPVAPITHSPPPPHPTEATGNIMEDIKNGVTNAPFNVPRVEPSFAVHDLTDSNEGYSGTAAPATATDGFTATGEEEVLPGTPDYEAEHQEDNEPLSAEGEVIASDYAAAAMGRKEGRMGGGLGHSGHMGKGNGMRGHNGMHRNGQGKQQKMPKEFVLASLGAAQNGF